MTDPIAWPFSTGGECSEQLGWLTDNMPAATGPEQRNRLRDTPHVWLGWDGLAEGDERRQLDQLLNANGAGTWWVPWPMEGQALAAPVPADATSIVVDTRWRHYAAGGRALLVRGLACEVVQVQALSPGALTLLEGTQSAWPAGTLVYPCFRARLDTVPDLSRFTGDSAPYTIKFRSDEPIDWPADAGPGLYRGLPVLDVAVEWTADPVDTPERALLQVSNEMSLPFVYDPVGQARNRIRVSVTTEGLPQVAALRSLFYALAGCWGVVWVPSQAQDLRVVGDVDGGTVTLDVAHIGISATPLVDNRRDIRITLHNGTTFDRRITAASAASSTIERLTVSSAFLPGFSAADVAHVGFLQLCRQEADVNLMSFWRHDVARSSLEFRGEARHGL